MHNYHLLGSNRITNPDLELVFFMSALSLNDFMAIFSLPLWHQYTKNQKEFT